MLTMMILMMSVCHRSAEVLVPKVSLHVVTYLEGRGWGRVTVGENTYMQEVTQLLSLCLSLSLSVFHLSSHKHPQCAGCMPVHTHANTHSHEGGGRKEKKGKQGEGSDSAPWTALDCNTRWRCCRPASSREGNGEGEEGDGGDQGGVSPSHINCTLLPRPWHFRSILFSRN